MKIIRDKLKIADNIKDQNPIRSIINKKQQLLSCYKDKKLKSKGTHSGTNQTLPITRVLVKNESQDVSIQSNKYTNWYYYIKDIGQLQKATDRLGPI